MTKHESKSILWVDDDIDLLHPLIARVERILNVKIDTVSTIDSAIHLLQIPLYDLIITDSIISYEKARYGVLGGEYLIEEVRIGNFDRGEAKVMNIPIIVLSVGAMENYENKLREKWSEVYVFNKAEIGETNFFSKFKKLITELL